MKKLLTTMALAGLLLGSQSASAGGNHDRIRAWIAESMQWRMSYLPTVYQRSDVFGLPDFSFQGAATLQRSRNGLKGSIMSNVENAGAPYTLWIMVVNNPGACTETPCSVPDLFNPETETSAHSGGAAISAANGAGGGVVNVSFDLLAGPLPDGLFSLFGENPGLHRGNGFSAEVFLVIDSHNDYVPGTSWLDDLTTTDDTPGRNHRIAIFTAVE